MSEKTKIIQCFLPPMIAGSYNADVTQSVIKGSVSIEDINKTFDFGVDAARFALNSEDIYSVYPPANQFGYFSDSLPHTVFSRRTLPWERTIDGKPPVYARTATPLAKKTTQESPPVPWMAIILFDEDEMKDLKISNSTIGEIISPSKTNGVTCPEIFKHGTSGDVLTLMDWEAESDGCLTIDITKAQFEKHIPSMESLAYLAHSKEVSIDHKDKNGIADVTEDGTGLFSVIVGNSLPTSGKQYTAILVSLEGYTAYLKDASPKTDIPSTNKVRLVVLANWKFKNSGVAGFLELANGIETKSMMIKRDNEEAALLPYFDAGYAPLEHLTRTGASTISWYHGPLLPRFSPATSKSISFSSADAALRYDKTTGFFDVSYAAAWQLGRMLGLQNQSFSKAMLSWRLEEKLAKATAKRKEEIDQVIGDTSDAPLKDKVINYVANLQSVEGVEVVAKPTEAKEDIPLIVRDFLEHLYRLNGIPFPYLVPNELFLEKNHVKGNNKFSGTLSAFYLDPSWIEALIDGALSLGRVNATDKILDKVMTGQLISGYVNQNLNNPEGGSNIPVRMLNITGFLMRSDLISGWRGIEIEAYDEADKLLPSLRFERVDTDIFLGIFNGNVSYIVITQPYEGLHFGLKKDGNEFKKNLKNEDGSNQVLADGSADINKELKDGLIKDGILDIKGMASAMKKKLTAKKWMNTEGENAGKYFTSAEFAYQMVVSPVKRKIKFNITIN